MRYLVRLILIIVVLAAVAVVGYAYVGDLSPDRAPVSQPLELDGA
jgi:Tfp pilus assembly protein PilO